MNPLLSWHGGVCFGIPGAASGAKEQQVDEICVIVITQFSPKISRCHQRMVHLKNVSALLETLKFLQ